MQRWKIALFGFALATSSLAGCATSARNGRVYVRLGPPPERREVIVDRPGPEYVYIRGHWAYEGGGYNWVPGRWERPEGRYHRWREGHWAHDRGGYYWVDGHWS